MIETYQIILIFSLIILVFIVQYSNTSIDREINIVNYSNNFVNYIYHSMVEKIISSFIKDTSEKELFILLYIPVFED